MRLSNPTILITREIDQSLLNEMISKGFDVDVISFIQTDTLKTKELRQKIEDVLKLDSLIVFTSNNAVKAVGEHVKSKKPNWKIYCIGNTTRDLAEKLFGKQNITTTADDASALAKKIIADKKSVNKVYFFCGNKKRNELPDLLKQHDIEVNEIEVYITTILQHKIGKNYDAVLFFSPSAVSGFFESNSAINKTILFAIGNTTAEEIRKFVSNKIVISDKPGKENLIRKVIEYFKN